MKKLSLIIVVVSTLTMLLGGCGSSSSSDIATNQAENSKAIAPDGSNHEADSSKTNDTAVKQTENLETPISIGNSYSTTSDLEFNIFKVITSNKLQCVGGGGSYYEADSGENYVDVVLNITNNSTSDLSARDEITAYFISKDGTQYNNVLIAVESSDDRISPYEDIKSLSTRKVHIGYELPTGVSEGKGYIQFGDDLFSVEYDSDIEISSKIPVSMNEEVNLADVASFRLLKTNFTADVLPPNTSGFYTHYEVDDPANDTYFVVYCDITNDSASAIGADDMISIKAIFDGKYEYNSNMALEEKDGTGFDYANITSIEPLETRKGVFMFEIPKKVQNMSVELSIYFYGNEYSYTE